MSAPLSPEQRAEMMSALAYTEPADAEQVRRALSDVLSVSGHNHQSTILERLRNAQRAVPAIVRRLLDAEAEVERLQAEAERLQGVADREHKAFIDTHNALNLLRDDANARVAELGRELASANASLDTAAKALRGRDEQLARVQAFAVSHEYRWLHELLDGYGTHGGAL